MRGVMVSNSFSVGEEGAKPLTSLKRDTEFGISQSLFLGHSKTALPP